MPPPALLNTLGVQVLSISREPASVSVRLQRHKSQLVKNAVEIEPKRI